MISNQNNINNSFSSCACPEPNFAQLQGPTQGEMAGACHTGEREDEWLRSVGRKA
jgi:hypothetical protein